MSKQRETKFKEKVLSRLSSLKPRIWFFKVQLVALRGIPDVVGVANGRFFAWELKVPPNQPTQLQSFVLEKIALAGGIARVVTPANLDECFEEVESCLSYQEKRTKR